MGKKAKNKVYLDRISSLPDPILSHILSFLPGKDSVRSSVLSSRWRYLFKSMSTLDFDRYFDKSSWPRFRTEENVNRFMNFVDEFFFYPNQTSLEFLRVYPFWFYSTKRGSQYDDEFRLEGWICAALWRGVKEIDIYFSIDDWIDIPNFLWTCQSLVTLKLDVVSYDVPPNICLPNLKTLHLTKVQYRGGCEIHRLISSLHVLEDLVISEIQLDETSELNIHNLTLKSFVLEFECLMECEEYDFVIVINAPSLVYFRYFDVLREGYTLSVNSLEKADITIAEKYEEDRELGATQLLQGICSVQTLSLTPLNYFETLPRRLLDEHIAFHNLAELKFYGRHSVWKETWLVEFLHCTPNLKTLDLHLDAAKTGFRDLPEEVPSCLSFHLKKITISDFKGDKHMLELITYFLNNATVLEKLVLGIKALSEKNQLRILKKLLMLPRKSMKCQVVTI